MVAKLPPHALVFVISGASQPFWHAMLLNAAPELVATWTVRTSLSEAEAKGWATRATCARLPPPAAAAPPTPPHPPPPPCILARPRPAPSRQPNAAETARPLPVLCAQAAGRSTR